MKEYKLHSHGKDWYHFRYDLTNTMESFSITYLHDGTIVMHGDYGCLAVQREWFPNNCDYGFPSKDSGIGYFAEKVVRAEDSQKIREWTHENTVKDLKDAIQQYGDNYEEHDVYYNAYLHMLKELESIEYSEHEFAEEFMKFDIDTDAWSDMGIDYTDIFKHKFECMKSVSDIILQTIQDDNSIDNDCFDVGTFVYHIADQRINIMKLLIIDTLSDGWFCCQYIHHRMLNITPQRKFHESELEIIRIANDHAQGEVE